MRERCGAVPYGCGANHSCAAVPTRGSRREGQPAKPRGKPEPPPREQCHEHQREEHHGERRELHKRLASLQLGWQRSCESDGQRDREHEGWHLVQELEGQRRAMKAEQAREHRIEQRERRTGHVPHVQRAGTSEHADPPHDPVLLAARTAHQQRLRYKKQKPRRAEDGVRVREAVGVADAREVLWPEGGDG
jgi:hypothetical protein